jgi:hypothetical protein
LDLVALDLVVLELGIVTTPPDLGVSEPPAPVDCAAANGTAQTRTAGTRRHSAGIRIDISPAGSLSRRGPIPTAVTRQTR